MVPALFLSWHHCPSMTGITSEEFCQWECNNNNRNLTYWETMLFLYVDDGVFPFATRGATDSNI